MEPAVLSFDRGSVVVRGGLRVPHATWDERTKAFRAQALYYRDILEYLNRSGIPVRDSVQDLAPSPTTLACGAELRGYQEKALRAWDEAGRRGVIVLPTGAGKTVIGMKAVELVNQPAIVVVPTIDLLEQWRSRLEEAFRVEVGVYGGGEYTLGALTVSTYDSAYLRAAEIGNRFDLAIFDEVHHLPAESFRQIAEMFTTPARLGLTATYEREDELHLELPRLIGGVVYRMAPEDLAGRYLSEYTASRRSVELTEGEKREYERNHKAFTDYLSKNRMWLGTPAGFRRFIMRSAWDAEARKALLARNRAIDVAFNSESKLAAIEAILRENPDERVLIFTQHNQLVYRISRRFLIPFVTHTTDREERERVIEGFRRGRFRAIVTSKVLDEGIDVPEASLGLIVSGTGSSREYVQRLGRLLRKSEGKQARLIELVSRETTEVRTSQRRKRTATGGGG